MPCLSAHPSGVYLPQEYDAKPWTSYKSKHYHDKKSVEPPNKQPFLVASTLLSYQLKVVVLNVWRLLLQSWQKSVITSKQFTTNASTIWSETTHYHTQSVTCEYSDSYWAEKCILEQEVHSPWPSTQDWDPTLQALCLWKVHDAIHSQNQKPLKLSLLHRKEPIAFFAPSSLATCAPSKNISGFYRNVWRYFITGDHHLVQLEVGLQCLCTLAHARCVWQS